MNSRTPDDAGLRHNDALFVGSTMTLRPGADVSSLTNSAGCFTVPGPASATQFMGAYVAVSQHHSNLQAVVAESLSDGVLTGSEQQRIEAAAAGVDRSNEALRGTIAAAAGKALKVVGV